MSDFFSKIEPILIALQNLQDNHFTVYIHCSKINSLFQVLKLVPQAIENEKNQTSDKKSTKRTINFVNRNSIQNILNTIGQFQNLASQCVKETCADFLLNNSVKLAKKDIRSFRDSFHSNFESLKLNSVAALFKISKDDLTSQDLVDMKRLSQILTQLSLKNKTESTFKISQRFKSLKKLGIESSLGEKSVLTFPTLKITSAHLVLKHEDVRMGKEIGRGQSGSVYIGYVHKKTVESSSEADESETDEIEVAVKVLFRRALTQPELESFRREIFALSSLSHPYLIKFYGYTEDPPFYIVTEYMSNGSVFQVLRSQPDKLTPTKRSLIAIDVARGLEFLHQKNVIHRDMKSLNVLLDSKYRAKICDFGMVRLNSSDDSPKTGLIGTAHWMAPEVLMSSPTYDNKVDVYSFGIFLWELLTGDMPYKDQKPHEIVSIVMDGGRPPMPSRVPEKLSELICKCWAQDPSERPTMTSIIFSLSNNACHFPGTDEAEFRSEVGVCIHHKSAISFTSRRINTGYDAEILPANKEQTNQRGAKKYRTHSSAKKKMKDDYLDINIDDLRAAEAESVQQQSDALKPSDFHMTSSASKASEDTLSSECSNDNSSSKNVETSPKKKSLNSGFNVMDTNGLIDLAKSPNEELQLSALDQLFKRISLNKREVSIVAKADLCPVISKMLDEHSPSSDRMLTILLESFSSLADSAPFFNIVVLKSLLSYAELHQPEYENMRSRALSILVLASNAQIDFLKESPLFIYQLLSFLIKPPSNQQCKSLLQLAKQLLNGTTVYPGISVLQLLFNIKTSLPEALKTTVISCIVPIVSTFKESRQQMTREMFIDCIKDIELSYPILDAYISEIPHRSFSNNKNSESMSSDQEEESSSRDKTKKKKKTKHRKKRSLKNDQVFISLLFQAKSSEKVYEFLIKIASNSRFARFIAQSLPISISPNVASLLYRPLFDHPNCIDYMVKLTEFYSVLSYLITQHEYSLVSLVLRSVDNVPADLVNATPLCRLITDAFNQIINSNLKKTKSGRLMKADSDNDNQPCDLSNLFELNSQDEADVILLMGSVYALSKDNSFFSDFNDLFPTIWNMLVYGPSTLKLPSFLSVTTIAKFRMDGIDAKLLFNLCAMYVSYNSRITREVAFDFIKSHINDQTIDQIEAVEIFLNNNTNLYYDEMQREVIITFFDAIKLSTNPKSEVLKKRLEELYHSLSPNRK